MYRTNVVGLFLILGAAAGFTLGMVVGGGGMATIYGAAGTGLGIVLGAAIASTLPRASKRR